MKKDISSDISTSLFKRLTLNRVQKGSKDSLCKAVLSCLPTPTTQRGIEISTRKERQAVLGKQLLIKSQTYSNTQSPSLTKELPAPQ